MTQARLRFLHASDFHLERPIIGLPQAPDHLRDLLIDAPYRAAERVFEAAVLEEVDFVVLAGDLLHAPTAGPRAVAFLHEQFELLHEHGIAVYWATGKADPHHLWPAAPSLPAGVHVFSTNSMEEVSHFRDERAIATIVGRGSDGKRKLRPADFRVDASEEFVVAVANGEADPRTLANKGIDYWALGGRGAARTLCDAQPVARYCGSPQGRTPRETGPHGCTLATVDDDRQVILRNIPTDVARWAHASLSLSADDERELLEALLAEQIRKLAAEAGERAQLVRFSVAAGGPLGELLRRGLADELTTWMQNKFGQGDPPLWTVTIEAAPSAEIDERLCEEDTILGDFLRAARDQLADPDAALDAHALLGDNRAAEVVGAVLDLSAAPARDAVFREAAALGVDLLRGGEKIEEMST